MTSDEDLVARSIDGDTDSFNQLVKRWERPIYALAYRTLGRDEDARDVTQETFLRAFRSIGGFRGQAKFSSWLYRIALNLCRDWMRKERRAPVVQAPEGVDIIEMASEPDPGESIEDVVARQNLSAHVQRAMALLSEGVAASGRGSEKEPLTTSDHPVDTYGFEPVARTRMFTLRDSPTPSLGYVLHVVA